MPKLMEETDDRAVKVPSLSELSKHTSKNLRYAPFILKADIAQCFPSIYTHSIVWAAYGVDQAKRDISRKSATTYFNALDFFVHSGQRGNTRGVLIGPDAYRLIAEFVLAKIDEQLHQQVGSLIVGAVRHVDDYYIGLRTEHDAQSVLSRLREVLAGFELNLNDNKTSLRLLRVHRKEIPQGQAPLHADRRPLPLHRRALAGCGARGSRRGGEEQPAARLHHAHHRPRP